MCTCISRKIGDKNYFGRTMDIEADFGQKVVFTPRNYPYSLKNGRNIESHFAILGMAVIENGYPLYADAMNEKGLSMAGLNFPLSAHYEKIEKEISQNALAPYELIPFVLSSADDVPSAKRLLSQIKICDIPFNEEIGTSPLHFQISDRRGDCIVLEPSREGIKIYDNKTGVVTNEPPFPSQIAHLENFRGLSSSSRGGKMKDAFKLSEPSLGDGAIGLPGDYSSLSRFVRAAYLSANAEFEDSEEDRTCGLFHIFESVSIVRGTVKSKSGNHYTHYVSVMDTAECVYRFRTYNDLSVRAISFSQAELDGDSLTEYSL